MVGTFYLRPKPESPPFVSVGTKVTPETTVCIIEAMKILNQIEADRTGTVVAIVACEILPDRSVSAKPVT